MQITDSQAAALRQFRRLNARDTLRELVDQFVAQAERDLVTQETNEAARVEFLRLRELRTILFGE